MTRFLLLIAFGAVTVGAAAAQDTQVCPADAAVCTLEQGQYINRVVNDDVIEDASGTQRKRADRIYELQQGNIYFFDGQVRNTGYHLRIFGAEGEGEMPLIYATQTASGGDIGDFIKQEADITLKNFALSGIIEDPDLNPQGLALLPAGVIRVEAPGARLIMDNVVMSNTTNRFVRAQSALKAMYVTNSVFANSGFNGENGTNLGNGKAFDLRDGSIDSLVIRNTTFTNFTDRIIRHRGSTGPIDVLIFDHNTVMNDFAYHGMFALGEVGKRVVITNNLFIDNFVAGSDTSDTVRQSEFNETGELDASGSEKMAWVQSVPNDVTDWKVQNNVYVVSPELDAFYATYGDGMGDDGNPDNGTDGDNDIIGAGAPLTDHILSRIDNDDTAFVEADLTVADRPATMINLGTWYRTETGRTKATESFVTAEDDYDRKTLLYYLDSGDLDASYATSATAYTAAKGSCPAGDLNWFPGEFDRCDAIAVVNEGGPGTTAGGLAELLPTAPNPTRGAATLSYTLANPSQVELTIVNMLGQTVATVVPARTEAAGTHSVRWSGELAAGVYVVRLRTEDAVATRRLTVVR